MEKNFKAPNNASHIFLLREDLRVLYEKVRNSRCVYKVILNDSLLNVFRMLYESSEQKDSYGQDFFKNIYTKGSFLAEVQSIAEAPIPPSILFVDAFMGSCYQISRYLDNFFMELYARKNGITKNQISLDSVFYKDFEKFLTNFGGLNITFMLAYDNIDFYLVNGVYEKKFLRQVNEDKNKSRISLVTDYISLTNNIQENFAQNTRFLPSFIDVKNIDLLMKKMELEGFSINFIEDMYVASRLIEGDNGVIGAYVVKINRMVNGNYVVTPDILFDKLTNVEIVLDEIKNSLISKGLPRVNLAFDYLKNTNEGMLQFLIFFFSYNLNLILFEDILKTQNASSYIDILKINCYFNSFRTKELGKLIKEVITLNTKFLSINDMDEIFKRMGNSSFNYIINSNGINCSLEKLNEIMGKTLGIESFLYREYDIDAKFYRYEMEPFIKRNKALKELQFKSIYELLDKTTVYRGVLEKQQLNELFCLIVKYIDKHYLNLHYVSSQDDKSLTYQLRYNLTLKAFFLHYKEILKYFNVLAGLFINIGEKQIQNEFKEFIITINEHITPEELESVNNCIHYFNRRGMLYYYYRVPEYGLDRNNRFMDQKEKMKKLAKEGQEYMRMLNKITEFYKIKERIR